MKIITVAYTKCTSKYKCLGQACTPLHSLKINLLHARGSGPLQTATHARQPGETRSSTEV